jgi:hypothetical protein
MAEQKGKHLFKTCLDINFATIHGLVVSSSRSQSNQNLFFTFSWFLTGLTVLLFPVFNGESRCNKWTTGIKLSASQMLWKNSTNVAMTK